MFSCVSICTQEMESGGQTTHKRGVGLVISSEKDWEKEL